MVQPIQKQPGPPQSWMPAPALPTDSPSGLEDLTMVDQLLCHQVVESSLQYFVGSIKNRYVIKNAMEQQLYYLFEEPNVCARMFCRKARELTLHVVNTSNQEVMRMGGCSWCANSCGYEVTVEALPGTLIGRVKQTLLGYIVMGVARTYYWFLLINIYCILTASEEDFCDITTESCDANANTVDNENVDLKSFRLTRPFDVKRGSVETIKSNDGRLLKKTVLSEKPLLFEFESFLTDEECDRLIEMATSKGLTPGFTERHERIKKFQFYDINSDKQLDYNEMRITLEANYDMYLKPDDIQAMYRELKLDVNADGLLSQAEAAQTLPDVRILDDYVYQLGKDNPTLKGRNSNHVFINPDQTSDPIVRNIVERVARLTGLPMVLMNKSDIQVVHYGTTGHYNVHMDSSTRNTLPCCHRYPNAPKLCRSCRWITMLFYLNEVLGGGETAFPVADSAEFDEIAFRNSHHIDLHLHCDDANLKVSPRKGKAVLWYNHLAGKDETEWFGEADHFAHHGSCPVTKGEKWVANFWIKVTDDREWDLTPVTVAS